MKSAFLLLPLLAGSPADDSCASKGPENGPKDIVSTAVAAGNFQTLAAALEAADLIGALQGDGPFTVFAPTDEAFAALPEGTVQTLLEPANRPLLQAILKFHVVAGDYEADRVASSPWLTSLQGQRLPIAAQDGVRVAGAKVLAADLACSNGVIHVIDRVVLPTTADLVGLAVENGGFTTLAAALQAAGLVEALQGDGPFTVFAPTDEAFAALPEGTVASLLKPENKAKLQAVLQYHVVAGKQMLGAALSAGRADTLQGSGLPIRFVDGEVRVGEARVLQADLEARNGVVHVIDRVLIP